MPLGIASATQDLTPAFAPCSPACSDLRRPDPLHVGLSWAIWRALGRSVPIAVPPTDHRPVARGHWRATQGAGILRQRPATSSAGSPCCCWPSPRGSKRGELVHLPGAFPLTAGAAGEARCASSPAPVMALLLPFAVGTLAAKLWFNPCRAGALPHGEQWWGALAIGLGLAVSAWLPVLFGVASSGPAPAADAHRAAHRGTRRRGALDRRRCCCWRPKRRRCSHRLLVKPAAAIALAATLANVRRARRRGTPAQAIWLAMPLFLAAGAWSSSQLGLHELLGATSRARSCPATGPPAAGGRLGQFALIGLAPVFFGHSGLGVIDGSGAARLGRCRPRPRCWCWRWRKLVAVLACSPAGGCRGAGARGGHAAVRGADGDRGRDILATGACCPEHAFAALVTLAVLSTLLTRAGLPLDRAAGGADGERQRRSALHEVGGGGGARGLGSTCEGPWDCYSGARTTPQGLDIDMGP